MQYPAVDIIVLNYNGKKFLPPCFDSLQKYAYPNQLVYLLDNASTDDDIVYVEAHYPWVKIIRNAYNNGYCAAYNLALAKTQSPYLVCLNNDVEVQEGWLNHLVEMAESNPKIAAIQPKILAKNFTGKFDYAGACGGLMDVWGFPFARGRIFAKTELDTAQYDLPQTVFWASGAALFLRRSAINPLDFLDETIVHHMDEVDLCWRLWQRGFEVWVQPKSVILHVGGATITTAGFKKKYWNHRNALYIMLKNYQFKWLCMFVTGHVFLDWFYAIMRLCMFDLKTFAAISKAHFWVLFNLFLIANKRKIVAVKRTKSDKEVFSQMYTGSIVWMHFVKGIHTYQQLKISKS